MSIKKTKQNDTKTNKVLEEQLAAVAQPNSTIQNQVEQDEEIRLGKRVQRLEKDIHPEEKYYVENRAVRKNLASLKEDRCVSFSGGKAVLELLFEWLQEERKPLFALLGQYGMGKTFTSKTFAKQQIQAYQNAQESSQYLPLYFDLRDFDTQMLLDKRDMNIWEIIEVILKRRSRAAITEEQALTAQDIQEIWKTQNCLLIFDGLDEVMTHLKDLQLEQYFVGEIFKLIPDFQFKLGKQEADKPQYKMLLTCRTDYFKTLAEQSSFFQRQGQAHIDLQEDYTCAVLSPFSTEQVKEYLKEMLRSKKEAGTSQAVLEQEAEKIYQNLQAIHNLAELSQRPVLLDFLSEIIDDLESMVLQRKTITTASVYERMVAKSLERDKEKHKIPIGIKLDILVELAAFLWKGAQKRLAFDKLSVFLSEYMSNGTAAMRKIYMQTPEETLYKDLQNATLLIRSKNKDFGFSHTSLQEYFLAQYILKKLEKGDFAALALKKVNTETFQFVMDLLSQKEAGELTLLQENFKVSMHETGELCRSLMFDLYLKDQSSRKRLGKPQPFNLSGLRIDTLNLEGTARRPLDLSHSQWEKAVVTELTAQYINWDHSNFSHSQLYKVKLQNVSLNHSDWSYSFVSGKMRNIVAKDIQIKEADWHFTSISKSKWNALTDAPKKFPLLLDKNPDLEESSLSCQVIQGHLHGIDECIILNEEKQAITYSNDGRFIVWDLQSGEGLIQLSTDQNWGFCGMFKIDEWRAISSLTNGHLTIWDWKSQTPIHQLKGHTERVNHCAISPDGLWALSCSEGKENHLILWNLESGELIRHLKGHSKSVNYCSILADGKRALSCSDDDEDASNFILWDLEKGEVIKHLKGHKEAVTSCTVLSDGIRVLSCSNDNTLILWNVESGEIIHRLKGHDYSVLYCTVLSGELQALSCSTELILWDLTSGEAIHTMDEHSRTIQHCAVFPDGKRAVSCSDDNRLILWDLESGQKIKSLKGHTFWARYANVLAGGAQILSCANDESLILWDVENGEQIHHFSKENDCVYHCTLLADESKFLSCSDDGNLFLWNLESGQLIHKLKGHKKDINRCTVFADGKRALSCSDDRSLIVWDLESGEKIQTLIGHSNHVEHCTVLSDGKRALSCAGYKNLILWDLESGEAIHTMKGERSSTRDYIVFSGEQKVLTYSSFYFNLWDLESGEGVQALKEEHCINHCVLFDFTNMRPGGLHAMLCYNDGRTFLWSVNDGGGQHLRGHTKHVYHCDVTAGGSYGLSCSEDGTVIYWNLFHANLIQIMKGHQSAVHYCTFLSDEKRALSCSDDGSLILWDLEKGELIHTMQGHTNFVRYCEAVADETQVLSCSYDGSLILWDLTSGKAIKTLNGHKSPVLKCSVATNGIQALSCSKDGNLILWDLEKGEAIHHLQGHSQSINQCMMLPNEQQALSCSDDGNLILWNLQTAKAIHTLEGHTQAVNHFSLLEDGQQVISSSDDGTMIVWDLASGEAIKHLKEHTSSVLQCSIAVERKQALSCSKDGILIEWKIEIEDWKKRYENESYMYINHCTLLANESQLLSCADDGGLVLWDLEKKKAIKHMKGHMEEVAYFSVSPDETQALSCSKDHNLILWDLEKGEAIHELEGHLGEVHYCAFLADGLRALSCSDDNTLILWDLKSGTSIHRLKGHIDSVEKCLILSDQWRALSWSSDGSSILWNLQTGKAITTYYHLPNEGHASIREGKLLSQSENAWEYLRFVGQDENGERIVHHFDEIK